jgi:serine/threonine protein kinase
VAKVPELEQAALVRELILAEVHYRQQAGEGPQPEDYQARFPELDPAWLASAVNGPLEASHRERQVDREAAAARGSQNDCTHPRRLGDYSILREIGRGGMGIVYEALQVSLNRRVALKVLGGGLGLTAKAVQRFHREAAAAARLHHTNIVPVYATGEEDGTHFYAMELIDGPSLDHVIRQLRRTREVHQSPGEMSHPRTDTSPSPSLAATGPYVPESDSRPTFSAEAIHSDSHYFDTIARMVAEVADALEYAHRQGVIHRDIKPSNLLLSPAGRLSLNDFGLARVLEQPGMTLSGEFVGTPAYMSPEQVAVGRIPLDQRTDIYSLGATLYELLALQPPYQGQSREQILAQIVHKEPKAPRRIQKKVPADLETICLKCLEKDPDRRYQSAGALAEDLRRYVNRFAISARRVGPAQRLVKWARRRPAVAARCVALETVPRTVPDWPFPARRGRPRCRTEALRESCRHSRSLDLSMGVEPDVPRSTEERPQVAAVDSGTRGATQATVDRAFALAVVPFRPRSPAHPVVGAA